MVSKGMVNGDGVGKDDNDEDWEDDNLSRLYLE